MKNIQLKILRSLPNFIVVLMRWIKQFIYFVRHAVKISLSKEFAQQNRLSKAEEEKWAEKRVSLGEKHLDKTFFIIRRISQVEGHFSMLNTVLGHLVKADAKGYIPVVDMLNYPSTVWQASERIGKENAWEYFYKQPGSYKLDDVSEAKSVIYSQAINPSVKPSLSKYFKISAKELIKWHELYEKYIIFNNETKNYLESVYSGFDISSKRVLALSIRRGIEWGHLTNHSGYDSYMTHPTLTEFIALVHEKIHSWHCDYIFLSIDDEEGLDIMKKEFDDKLLFIHRERPVQFRDGLPIPLKERHEIIKREFKPRTQENLHDRELKFLAEVFIMSRCNYFIGSYTTANTAALVMNGNKFEQFYLI